jgi:tRNA(Ile)-lysidine synthetase-like protein
MNDQRTEPVSYVVAVSGGVDSVVLLHILARRLPADRLMVAHFDHGVRADSAEDRRLVEKLAYEYGLEFAYDEGRLGSEVSEADAREARYAFLRRVKQLRGADYIVTAHHEDDVMETAIINLLRGTGRKGLSSLRSHGDLYRPLLPTPKAHITAYAHNHNLQWHEDSTNKNPDYLRNYVRQQIMPKFDASARQRLRRLIIEMRHSNIQIDSLLAAQLHLQPAGDSLEREWFIMLPHSVAKEIIAAWLRRLGVTSFDRQTIERLTVAAKTYAPGKQIDVNRGLVMVVSKDELRIRQRYGPQ